MNTYNSIHAMKLIAYTFLTIITCTSWCGGDNPRNNGRTGHQRHIGVQRPTSDQDKRKIIASIVRRVEDKNRETLNANRALGTAQSNDVNVSCRRKSNILDCIKFLLTQGHNTPILPTPDHHHPFRPETSPIPSIEYGLILSNQLKDPYLANQFLKLKTEETRWPHTTMKEIVDCNSHYRNFPEDFNFRLT